MKNKKILYIIFIIIIIIAIGVYMFFFMKNKNNVEYKNNINQPVTNETASSETNDTIMVDCTESQDPMSCFVNRMNNCLPVTTKMTGSDSDTKIEITVVGIENEKCHFQRKINDSLNLDCYFQKGTLSSDTLDQMFGNDKGLKSVVDDACKTSGW